PASTCFTGRCVDSATVCNGSECGLPEEITGGGTGSANEAGSSDGAYDAELDGPGFEDARGTDATLGADGSATDGGQDASGSYPLCAFSPPAFHCAPTANGTFTSGSCETGAGPVPCCRCLCPTTMTAVGCTSMGGCSNLMPACVP